MLIENDWRDSYLMICVKFTKLEEKQSILVSKINLIFLNETHVTLYH